MPFTVDADGDQGTLQGRKLMEATASSAVDALQLAETPLKI